MDKNSDNNDDIKIEKDGDLDDSVVSEESAAETIKKLRGQLKEAQAKAAEYLAGWQRTQADFVNAKKRDALEREEFIKFAAEPVIIDVASAMDDFDAAFSDKESWEKLDKNWREGIERIYNRFKAALTKNGVKISDPTGEMFNPNDHLAVEMVNVSNSEDDGKVVGILHKGYSLNGRVIRPAKVKVGKHG